MSQQEYRYILRIMGTDVQGTLKTIYAVAQVKGVSSRARKRSPQKSRREP